VKELAERRTRQTIADRRLIADRTAKTLRMLALPGNIFRDRSLSRPMGRRVNLTDYLTSPPEEMDMEEEDGIEGYDGVTGDNTPSFIEGARVNSELYDAYAAHGWSAHPMDTSLSRRSHTGGPPPDFSETGNSVDSIHSSLPSLESRARNSSWFPNSTTFHGSTLSRQPSIRRGVRSRTVDFNDFSTRRRSTFRNAAADLDDPRSSEDIPNALTSWVSGPIPISDEPLGSPGARRFFPFSRRRHEVAVSSMPAWIDSGASTSRPVSPPISSYRPWRSNSGPPPLIAQGSFSDHEHSPTDDPERPEPRLRRGGLRAPESMLSRHASPANAGADQSSPIVISISREAHTVTTPAPEATEVVAPITVSVPTEQS